jgi:hypothetical protein
MNFRGKELQQYEKAYQNATQKAFCVSVFIKANNESNILHISDGTDSIMPL